MSSRNHPPPLPLPPHFFNQIQLEQYSPSSLSISSALSSSFHPSVSSFSPPPLSSIPIDQIISPLSSSSSSSPSALEPIFLSPTNYNNQPELLPLPLSPSDVPLPDSPTASSSAPTLPDPTTIPTQHQPSTTAESQSISPSDHSSSSRGGGGNISSGSIVRSRNKSSTSSGSIISSRISTADDTNPSTNSTTKPLETETETEPELIATTALPPSKPQQCSEHHQHQIKKLIATTSEIYHSTSPVEPNNYHHHPTSNLLSVVQPIGKRSRDSNQSKLFHRRRSRSSTISINSSSGVSSSGSNISSSNISGSSTGSSNLPNPVIVINNSNNNQSFSTFEKTQANHQPDISTGSSPKQSINKRSRLLSRVTVNFDGLIPISSSAPPLTSQSVRPVTNLSILPLYLIQPLLSPACLSSSISPRPAPPLNIRSDSIVYSPIKSPISLNQSQTNNQTLSFPLTPVTLALTLKRSKVSHRASQKELHQEQHQEKQVHPYDLWIEEKLQKSTQSINRALSFPRIVSLRKLMDSKVSKMVPDFLRFNNKSSSSRRSKRSDKVNLKDHYCCFAIPLYNVGIYSILTEFFIIGTVFGILSFSAPSILAVALPGILTSLFGFICLMIGMSQAAGFYGVYMEKVELFEKYVIVNVVLLLIGLVYSLVLMIISATRHDTATEECIIQFVSGDERSSVSESGRSVCDVWTWAQLAVCGILWFITGLSQLYFCHLQRVWSRDQKLDHLHYRTIVSAARDSMLGTNSQARGDPRSDAEDWETDSRVGSLDLNRVIREENVIQNSHQASSKQSSQRSNMKNSSRLKNQIGERTVAEEEEERLVAGSTLVSRVV